MNKTNISNINVQSSHKNTQNYLSQKNIKFFLYHYDLFIYQLIKFLIIICNKMDNVKNEKMTFLFVGFLL